MINCKKVRYSIVTNYIRELKHIYWRRVRYITGISSTASFLYSSLLRPRAQRPRWWSKKSPWLTGRKGLWFNL